MIDAEVDVSGPIFGQIDGTVNRAIEASNEKVGQELVSQVRLRLDKVLKDPSGHYESRIDYTALQGTTLITDSGVVYGAWLEGTSSRNATSRFKGYSTFRRVTQQMQDDVPDIVDDEMKQMTKELS